MAVSQSCSRRFGKDQGCVLVVVTNNCFGWTCHRLTTGQWPKQLLVTLAKTHSRGNCCCYTTEVNSVLKYCVFKMSSSYIDVQLLEVIVMKWFSLCVKINKNWTKLKLSGLYLTWKAKGWEFCSSSEDRWWKISHRTFCIFTHFMTARIYRSDTFCQVPLSRKCVLPNICAKQLLTGDQSMAVCCLLIWLVN